MSWHCPDWANNITDSISDFEDGADLEIIYSDVRCNRFDRTDYVIVDAWDEPQDSFSGDEVTCAEHSRRGRWDEEPDIADNLRLAGFWVCDDCLTAYHGLDDYNNHRLDDHGDGEDDEEDHPDLLDINGNVIGTWNWTTMSYRRPVVTTHGSWLP